MYSANEAIVLPRDSFKRVTSKYDRNDNDGL